MKKLLLVILLSMVAISFASAQAPDFTANDCNGYSHNLYTELNSGKVLVLVWVMPCGSCTGPALTAYNIVQSYASTNVLYYLIDDAANTSCTSLSSWATSSGIGTNRTTFSTSAIVENNYGGVGMPHIAVVATTNHSYFFNALNTAAGNSTAIQNAINDALQAVGINENISNTFQLTVAQTSAQSVHVKYSIKESSNVTLEIFNEVGQSVIRKEPGRQVPGDYTSAFDLTAAAIYFMRLTEGSNSQTVKFVFSK